MRLSIRLKLLLAIGLPFLLLAGMFLAWDYARLRDRAFDNARQNLSLIVGRAGAQLDGFFHAASNLTRATAEVTSARGIPPDGQIYGMLRAIVQDNPEVYGACFAIAPEALAAGRTRFAPYVCRDAASGGGLKSMDLSEAYDYTLPKWEWFERPFRTGEPWWTEPYFDEGAGNAAMVTFSMPVRVEGKTVAIATVDILLSDLQKRLTLATEFTDSRWLILSRNGTFVSAHDPSLLLTKTVFDIAKSRQRQGLDALGKKMVAGDRGSARFQRVDDGVTALGAFEPIPSTGWSFAMHVPEAEILGPVNHLLQLRLAAAAGAALALLAILLTVAYRIMRPIPHLAAAVRELSSGKLDARITGVNSRDELGELAAGFNKMVEDLKRHVQGLTDATAARERVESELRIAREIQLSLLPSTFPAFPERKEFDLHATNAAARSIAGDFFDFELIDENRLYFVIADVSGKGIPAAMFMAVTRTLLRNLNRTAASPGEMVTTANRILQGENRRGMFVTLFLGIYIIPTGRIRYVNAGHPIPRAYGPGGVRPFGEANGALVGIMEGETWTDGEETLAPGESLLLYTDGITEAGMGDLPLYGEKRMDDLLRTCAGMAAAEVTQALVADVARYQGEHPTDDVTLLALRRIQ